MSRPSFLAGTDNPGPALAVASLNLFVALALVSVSLLLGLAVSIMALLCDRARRCESAYNIDPRIARSINHLGCRSAFRPSTE
jgi:hypothetical protein